MAFKNTNLEGLCFGVSLVTHSRYCVPLDTLTRRFERERDNGVRVFRDTDCVLLDTFKGKGGGFEEP